MEYIFITGMGRSGTQFLSTLLERDHKVSSNHEFIGDREYWLLSWYLSESCYSKQYLNDRKIEIDKIFYKNEIFIDVNGYLQNSVEALEKTFPGCKIFHLVRNPKDVIRSLYTRRDKRSVDLIPKDNKSIEEWIKLDKFEQICWNWNETTKNIIATGKPVIKFEKLIADYNYVKENLLIPTGINLSKDEWNLVKNTRVNRTKSKIHRYFYSKVKGKAFNAIELPEYSQWTDKHKQTLHKFCGDTMRMLEY